MSRKASSRIIHKPEKPSKNKELAEIKRENHLLKRKLARAEKEAQRLLENSALTVEPEPDMAPDAKIVATNSCPTCEKELTVVTIGPKTLHACKNCGYRTVK